MRNLIIAVAVASAGFAASNIAQAAERWTCNVFSGPKNYINDALKPWGKEVAKVTNGEVRVRFLPTSAAPPPKQIDAIVAGTFDCAYIFHGFTAHRAIGPQFGILPFIGGSNGQTGSVAYHRIWTKYFADKNEFADDDVHILSMFQYPGGHFFTATDDPINSLEDLKSQKIWALAGTPSRTMKTVGISHVSGPAARVAEFTQTKVVQGVVGLARSALVVYAGIQFPKSGTFTTKSLMMPSFAWMVSTKKWNSLTDEQRRAISAISGEKLAKAAGKAVDDFEAESGKRLAEAGIKEVKASKEFEAELEKAASPQIEEWIKRAASIGVDGRKVLKEYDELVRQLGS